ncbi:hypothetical protein NDU88_006621 [Pleurodeles waltl]|uniref:Uncharacterized protein n=1 Tax=Pleurodeles waltl TaxID=8319 RepID=A0AAV7MG87_PLEWA|nr:hypothetical protein NDU88_006621 [Pleurodeles waltl]
MVSAAYRKVEADSVCGRPRTGIQCVPWPCPAVGCRLCSHRRSQAVQRKLASGTEGMCPISLACLFCNAWRVSQAEQKEVARPPKAAAMIIEEARAVNQTLC